MNKTLLSMMAASALMASVGAASAQTQTTESTTWTTDQGPLMREYSTTKHYESYSNSQWKPTVGAEYPSDAKMYPLPDTMKMEHADQYNYGMVNNNPVIVNRTTRKVVHTWE